MVNNMRKIQLIIIIAAVLIVGAVMPSFAQLVISAPNQTENVTFIPISGTVSYTPNHYNVDVKSVTDLTIYARSESGRDTKVNPAANGTFSMKVPGAGNYSFLVMPSKLDYLNTSTNATYSILYPDANTFTFYQIVTEAGLTGIVIPTNTVQTGKPMNATPVPPSVTPASTAAPQATPGFTFVAVLAALGVMAIALRKK
jgi:hypothetical protein